MPHHTSGLFLDFKAEWINPIHRQTYNRAFILPMGLSFSLFMSIILTTEFYTVLLHVILSLFSIKGEVLKTRLAL